MIRRSEIRQQRLENTIFALLEEIDSRGPHWRRAARELADYVADPGFPERAKAFRPFAEAVNIPTARAWAEWTGLARARTRPRLVVDNAPIGTRR